MKVIYRKAIKSDVPLVLTLIRELAKYEKMEKELVATEELLMNNLFGRKAFAEVIIVEIDGQEAGFVLFFHNFSTFLGKPGIYIEDLYVRPEHRNKGLGKGLIRHVSKLAVERDCGRVEWWVLNWNPARRFYESIGAVAMDEWVVYRLTGEKMHEMAAETQ